MSAGAPPSFNPVLLDLPDRIDTARLLLRAPRPGDGAVVHASVIETLDDLRRYPASMSWAVAERIGLRHEGTALSERADPDGTRRDMRVYALTR